MIWYNIISRNWYWDTSPDETPCPEPAKDETAREISRCLFHFTAEVNIRSSLEAPLLPRRDALSGAESRTWLQHLYMSMLNVWLNTYLVNYSMWRFCSQVTPCPAPAKDKRALAYGRTYQQQHTAKRRYPKDGRRGGRGNCKIKQYVEINPPTRHPVRWRK